MSSLTPDTDLIRTHFAALNRPGEVREVRVLEHRLASGYGGPKTASGYFDDAAALAEALSGIGSHRAKGVYITQNAVDPRLRARAANRLEHGARQTTADTDIARYQALTFDFDPIRPAGISATDDERDMALAVRDGFLGAVTDLGWPSPVAELMSGNGGMLTFRIDLPADAEGRGLVEAVLRAADRLFSTPAVLVDTTLVNPARIVKLAGTAAAKGDSLPERPHRLATGTFCADAAAVPAAALRAFAALAPAAEAPAAPHAGGRTLHASTGDAHDVPALLQRANIDFTERARDYGTVYQLSECLTSDAHRDGAAIFQFASGAVAYRCLHNSCAGKDWGDVRARLGVREPRHATAGADAGRPETPAGSRAAGAFGSQPVGMIANTVQLERVTWLWPGRLATGKQTVLDGDPGLGKSTLTLDIAARITTGAAMPGEDDGRDPRGVVLLSAEDGAADTIVPRLTAAGADLGRVYIMTGVLPVGGGPEDAATLQHIEAIESAIRAQDAALLIVDPIMAYLGADANAHKDQDVRRTLAPLAAMLDRTGCAGMLVRHLNKAAGGAAIYRGGGSIGIIGAARFGLLVARDPDDDDARIVAPVKCNIGKEPPALRYRLESVEGGDVARVTWEDEPVSIGANELLAASGGDENEQGERAEAKAWLRDFLDQGPQLSPDIFRAGHKVGFSTSTLRRAKKALGNVVTAEKTEFGGGWRWRLDPDETDETSPKMTTKREGAHSQKGEHLRETVSIFGSPEDWLVSHLASGSKPEYEVMRLAKAAGITESELIRAKVRLDVRAFEIPHQPGRWYWRPPDGEPVSAAFAADVAYAVGKLRQFTPDELEDFRAEVASAPPEDPNAAIDRAALAALDAEREAA